LVTLFLSQFFVFSLAYSSYFTLFKEGKTIDNKVLNFCLILFFISLLKIYIFFLRRKYRSEGNNYRNIVHFGRISSADKLEDLFHFKNDLGYRFIGFFSSKTYKSKKYLGHTKMGFKYIEENDIDEIYCDPSEFSSSQLIKIRKFAEKKDVALRLMPENNAIYSKDFVLEYFGTVPILKPKRLPFEKMDTHIKKRILDIFCSAFVCVYILTWLLPILWIVIRIDSKGPLFFKQKRDGINGTQFLCYKLRSMNVNNNADKVSASKNDTRITKVGAFLRRTSLDEFPQFFNVFLGDMSIVGPRPHMNLHTKKYINEVENYLIRNSVKPGITGLAQISGYRGEVIKKSDIKNRVRLDIFYIENWSFFLDIKIIAQTFFSVFIKEEKAY
jgi:putative colanic acid biosynthesis UDP-glucose lipid carrier transferase